MADLRFCLKAGAGFALVAGLSSVALAEGGEDLGSAVNIASFPFVDTGDTSDNTDDWDQTCPYTGSIQPDVFYSFTGDGSNLLMSLCDSGYDTKLYVLDSSFTVVACNDDTCGSDGFRSQVIVNNTTAQTYYIGVDGYGTTSGGAGAYLLSIETVAGCDVTCDPMAIDEGEPCGDDTNGGCNDSINLPFVNVVPGDTVCGTLWADNSLRDTDWYQIDHGGGVMDWSGEAETPLVLFIISSPCPSAAIVAIGDSAGLCGSAAATADLAADTYYLWAGIGGAGGSGIFSGYPCVDNNTYTATVSGTLPCPWDLDASGDVGFSDLLLILSHWGPCP